jgi:hypothetical protein
LPAPRPANSPQRIVVAPLRFANDPDRVGTFSQGGENEFTLKPRDGLTDAAVNAAAERNVAHDATLDVELIRVLPAPRIAVRSRKEEQHLLALADLHAAHLDLASRGAEECLHWRFEPQRFLKCIPREARIVAQELPLVRKTNEAIDRCGEAIDGSVDTRREEGAHEERCFVGRQFPLVDGRVNLARKTVRPKRLAAAILHDRVAHAIGLAHRLLKEIIARAERVEHHVAIRQ